MSKGSSEVLSAGAKDTGVLLSISMITYNQERYVKEAIDSVFNQNMPFEWELIISDDASTDGTAEMISSMTSWHPRVRFHRQPVNLGMHRNYKFAISQCKGIFIAQIEGDDFWIDPDKNRKQIDLLLAHPNMAWCSTNGIIVDEMSNLIRESVSDRPLEMTIQTFADPRSNFNPMNNSVMMRKSAEPELYPDFIFEIQQLDTALHYLRAAKGTIGFLPDKTLAYRQHDNSCSGRRELVGADNYLDWLKLYEGLRKMLPHEVSKHFNNKAAYFHMALKNLENKQNRLFLRNWWKSAGYPTWRDSLHYFRLWAIGR
jgi:glycosyltransferase involved in cell wall biosynthesis